MGGNSMKLIKCILICIFAIGVCFGLSSISYTTNNHKCIDGQVYILQNDYYVKRTVNGIPQECILEEKHQDN